MLVISTEAKISRRLNMIVGLHMAIIMKPGFGSDIGNRYRITLLSDRTLQASVIYQTRNAARTGIQRSENTV